MTLIRLTAAIQLLAAAGAAQSPPASWWPHWGGVDRDFRVPDAELAETWPADGPRELWSRALGNGKSAIAVARDRLFTMFTRDADRLEEVIVALDAATGTTLWETAYEVGYRNTPAYTGPHATPALTDELIVTVGVDAKVHACERRTGAVRWRRDLRLECDVDIPQSGYAASPLIHGDLVLLPGQGAPGYGVIALRVADGAVAWARHGFLSSHASPILIRAGGREHAVFHGTNRLFGLDPTTGDVLWSARVRTDAIDNVSFTPVWDAERSQLLVSHLYDGRGTQAVRLSERDGRWRAERVWGNRRLKVAHGNGVILGDAIYASDGAESAFTVGVDLVRGETLFKQRGIPKATFLATADKLLALDEEGCLRLLRVRADGVEELASTEALASSAWTVPTLVGHTLYLRDRDRIVALELP